MKKKDVSISNPEELDKYLQGSSFIVWLVLGSILLLLIGFFVTASIIKIPIERVLGKANVSMNKASLVVEESELEKLVIGQKVYIANQEGKLAFDEDNKPVVYNVSLENGQYDYSIIIKEKAPIEFLIS